jgi:hypothetical protein
MPRKSSRSSKVVQNVSNLPENTAVHHPNDDAAAQVQSDETTKVRIGEGQPKGEAYPAASETMTSEQHQAKEDAEADKRAARAEAAKGPRKLNPNERKIVAHWLDNYIGQNEAVEKVILFEEMDKDLKPFFQPSMQGNVVSRGVFAAHYDENHQLIGAYLTSIGADIFFRLQRKGKLDDGSGITKTPGQKATPSEEPSERKVRAGKYEDKYKIQRMVSGNPRRANTQGYFSWNLYEDGKSYHDYMKASFDKDLVADNGTPFGGPGRNHFDYDLMKGFIALYDSEQEIEDNGSPNPKYWFINNSGNHYPKTEGTTDTEPTEE